MGIHVHCHTTQVCNTLKWPLWTITTVVSEGMRGNNNDYHVINPLRFQEVSSKENSIICCASVKQEHESIHGRNLSKA